MNEFISYTKKVDTEESRCMDMYGVGVGVWERVEAQR